MPTKAVSHTDFPSSISQDIASLTNSSGRPPDSLPGSQSILLRCERDILKVCKALLEIDRKVNALSKACCRQAPPVYCRMSTALVDSGKQVIRGGIYNINATESFMLLASSSDDKGSLEVLSNNATSSTLQAATTSFTLSAAATTVTLQADRTSFTPSAAATSVTLQAATTSFTLSAAATSSTLPAAAMTFTLPAASTIQVAATSFTLAVSSSYNDSSKAKNKCGAAKIGGIKLETRGRGVSRLQSPMQVRHKRIKRGDETQYILADVDVAYSSRAVTYLSEVGVARGSSLSDGHHYNLPLARRRMLCQQC